MEIEGWELIVRLIGYLVWPATVLTIALIFRRPIKEMLTRLADRVPDLRSMKLLGNEVSFRRRAMELIEDASPIRDDTAEADLEAGLEPLIEARPAEAVRLANQALKDFTDLKLHELRAQADANVELPQDLSAQIAELNELLSEVSERLTPADAALYARATDAVAQRVDSTGVAYFRNGPHAGEKRVLGTQVSSTTTYNFKDGSVYRSTGTGHSVGEGGPVLWTFEYDEAESEERARRLTEVPEASWADFNRAMRERAYSWKGL